MSKIPSFLSANTLRLFFRDSPLSAPYAIQFGCVDTILSSRNGCDWLKPVRRLHLLGHRADSAVDGPVMEFGPVRLEGPLARVSVKGTSSLLLPALHPDHLSEETLPYYSWSCKERGFAESLQL